MFEGEGKKSARTNVPIRRIPPTYVIILTSAILSIFLGLLVLVTVIGSRMARDITPRIDAVMVVKYKTTRFHMMIDELVTGSNRVSPKEAWEQVNGARLYANALLNGGNTPENYTVFPLEDPRLNALLKQTVAQLGNLENSASALLQYGQSYESRIASYNAFDFAYNVVISTSDDVERVLHKDIAAQMKAFIYFSYAIGVVAVLASILVMFVIRKFEKNQARAVEELISSELRNRSIVDTSLDGIIKIDSKGRVEEINPSAETMFGWTSAEVKGMEITDFLFPGGGLKHNRATVANLLEKSENEIFGQYVGMSVTKKNGEEFPVDISLTSYVTNHLKFYTAFVVDLTEHVAAEKKQRELVKEAKTANSAKSEFLANMSHELRTPLNSIIGFAEMMEHEVRGPLPDDYREYSQLISGSGQLLLATVNSILDIAKIEAGKFDLHKEATDMVPIVGEITTLLSVQSNNKNIDLINDTHDLPCLYVDPLRARQIMMNIIGNAIKFTDEGRVRVTNRNFKNGYDITISDSGIGMTPDEVKIALKPFEQVYGTSLARRYQGTGLGLSLSRQIMELHGGKLIVESKPNKGTAVTLRFPLEAGVACAE